MEACFMVWGLGTGPVCVDCAAHLVLRRSGWLLSRLGVVVVGVLGSAGPGRCLVNLKGDSSSKHLSCPGSWALDPCASIAPPIPCFEEALDYFRDLEWSSWVGSARLGQVAASSISRGILLGSIFWGLRVGHWTPVRPSRRSSCASKKPFVTLKTCAGRRGRAGSGSASPLPHQSRGGFFLEASFNV